MMEFLVFVIGGFAGVYCYNHYEWYRRLVDGKDATMGNGNDE